MCWIKKKLNLNLLKQNNDNGYFNGEREKVLEYPLLLSIHKSWMAVGEERSHAYFMCAVAEQLTS